jgi:hypothetical protein
MQQQPPAPPDPLQQQQAAIAAMAAGMPALSAEWLAVLNHLGFGSDVRRTLARAHGITSLEDLSVYTTEDVRNIFKQLRTSLIVPQIVEVKTLALTRYAARLADSNTPLEPALVTEQLHADEALRSRKRAGGDDEESIIKQPGDFTDAAKWKMWNELFQNYLGSLLNRYRVPLLYVLREDDAILLDPAEIAALPTAHERFLQTTPLSGAQYETDNGRVFELLESLLIKGTYHSYIEPYKVARDGRGGYLALTTHFEGPTVIGTSLEDSYRSLEKLQFTGDKSNFSFDNFVDRHVKAYSSIKRLGGDDEVISDKKKVRDLLSRIRTNDAALLSAKVQVMANVAMSEDFTMCCDFMRQIARTISKSSYSKEKRLIGAANTRNDTAGLTSAAVPNIKWQKYGPAQKTHVWVLRGYDANDIDSRGNLRKGARKTGASSKKTSHLQMNKKQAAMLVSETIRQVNAANRDGDDVSKADDDDNNADSQEQGAGDSFAARRKKKPKKA